MVKIEERIFLTMLGDDGVAARLGYIKLSEPENYNPVVVPYPDFSWFQKGDCNGITSVYRIAVSSNVLIIQS